MPNETHTHRNEGEGSKTAAKAYNRAAREFADEGRVEPAAEQAKRAVDADPIGHVAAEKVGRDRAREEDPALRQSAWWTDEHEDTWARVKAAIRRDWEQTVYTLSGGSKGMDLDQTLADTLRQMTGAEPLPPPGEPIGVSLGVDWSAAEQAVQFGFAASDRFAGRTWDEQVERALAEEWHALPGAPPWPDARPHVFMGWYQRRRR